MDPRAIDEILSTTRSVRRRIDFERAVEPRVLLDCIEVATQAPTGLPPESWRFLVVTESEKKHAIAALYRRALGALVKARGRQKATQADLAARLHEMPALILICSVGRPATGSVAHQVAFYGSVLPAAWSLMLALRARGLGATWTTLHLIHEAEAAAILDIPDDVTQTVLLPVGYTRDAVLRPAVRRPAHEVTYWNGWGRSHE